MRKALNQPPPYGLRFNRIITLLPGNEYGKLKKNISIEQVRQLQNKLSLHSFLNTYKVGVITQAHTLSTEAANSLLKTLEEPTPKTI